MVKLSVCVELRHFMFRCMADMAVPSVLIDILLFITMKNDEIFSIIGPALKMISETLLK
jgi:hypothetical protein